MFAVNGFTNTFGENTTRLPGTGFSAPNPALAACSFFNPSFALDEPILPEMDNAHLALDLFPALGSDDFSTSVDFDDFSFTSASSVDSVDSVGSVDSVNSVDSFDSFEPFDFFNPEATPDAADLSVIADIVPTQEEMELYSPVLNPVQPASQAIFAPAPAPAFVEPALPFGTISPAQLSPCAAGSASLLNTPPMASALPAFSDEEIALLLEDTNSFSTVNNTFPTGDNTFPLSIDTLSIINNIMSSPTALPATEVTPELSNGSSSSTASPVFISPVATSPSVASPITALPAVASPVAVASPLPSPAPAPHAAPAASAAPAAAPIQHSFIFYNGSDDTESTTPVATQATPAHHYFSATRREPAPLSPEAIAAGTKQKTPRRRGPKISRPPSGEFTFVVYTPADAEAISNAVAPSGGRGKGKKRSTESLKSAADKAEKTKRAKKN